MDPAAVAPITSLPTNYLGASPAIIPSSAMGSMPTEDNTMHVAIAIGVIGLLVVVTGLVNARISIGRERG